MKVKVINTGKSPEIAEQKLQMALDGLNISKLISISDSGLRAIIVYEENKSVKGLTEKTDTLNIRESKANTKEPTSETKDTTNKRAGSKTSTRAQKDPKPKK